MSPERGDVKERTNHRGLLLDRGRGFKSEGKNSSPTEHVRTRAGTAATPEKLRNKRTSEENKQFDPGGKGPKAPLWNAAVTLPSFSEESVGPREARCLCFVFFVCALCPFHVCFVL